MIRARLSDIRNAGSSLRTQLIFYFMLSSLVVLAVGFYFIYIQIINIIEKQNEKLLLQQLKQSDNNIRSVLGETDRLIQLFLQDSRVDNFIQSNIHDESYEAMIINRDILTSISGFISSHSFIDSIYFFTEDRGELGRNAKNMVIVRNEEPAYFQSSLRNGLLANYPDTVWVSGYTDKFFNPSLTGAENHLFSVAKIVKSTLSGNKKADLVFNVSERYIASIYAGESGVSNMYIIDGEGNIISSGNGKSIGGHSDVISSINSGYNTVFGSFITKTGSTSIQTVYHHIGGTGWYLVGELPLQLFSTDVAVLQRILVIVFLSSILIIFLASFFWIKRITKPLNVLAGKMRDVGSGKLGVTLSRIPSNELGTVIKRFNEMSLNIADLVKKNAEIQEEKRRLEIEALQAQINPHFIYNTLNMIKWMAVMSKSKNIVESIVSLGSMLRPAFKSMDMMCAVGEEIDYIGNYLKIMNWRFGNGVSLVIDVPDHLLEYKVPRFILQPVVENSIIHGIRKPENLIQIGIVIREEKGSLIVTVSDTGTGIPQDRLGEIKAHLGDFTKGDWGGKDDSIGLYNVNRRIVLNFGGEYGVGIESRQGEGTQVTIRLPI